MKRTPLLLVLLGLGAAACASKATTIEPAQPTTGEHMAEHKMDHGTMPPEVVKFHDVLSPRWHAEAGPDRMKDTCAALPDLQTGADALVKAALPAGAESATWSTGTTQLVEAVAALKVTCDKPDAAAFEPAFKHVHESFHIVSGAVGPMHEGKAAGEHAHPGAH